MMLRFRLNHVLQVALLVVCNFATATTHRASAADDLRTHRLTSPYQPGETLVRVLLPSKLEPAKRYPVVYLLPVEAGLEHRYGDGLDTAREMDAADRFGVIVVAPTFAQLPWYADHPTDPAIRQESHFLKVVVPLVEREYPALREPRGRLLCGFSKSGWGAWSLLLRHPEIFGRAASWDAPLTMSWPSKYGSVPIFGTPENFAKYQITRLLDETKFDEPRLILLARGNFADHTPIHAQLERLKIPHTFRDDGPTPHVWSRAWLEPAFTELTR